MGFAGSLARGNVVEEQSRRVATDVQCTVIEGCGHFVPEEKPAELLQVLDPFLAPYAKV